MTRVMFFSDAPYYGGAEKYLELLVSALRRDTYEVCVLTAKGARLRGLRERLAGMGVTTFEVSLGGPYDVAGYAEVARMVRKWKPDVLHVNLPGTYNAQAGLVAPVAWFSGCHCIVTTEHLAMIEKLWKRHVAKRLSGLFLRAVVSVTESNVDFLTRVHRVPRSRIVVIYNGVDIAGLDKTVSSNVRSNLGLDASTFVFACVGSLTERKGQRYLLDAFAGLRPDGCRQTALLIVGDGEDETLLKRKCSELGVVSRVFFLAHRDDVQSIMRDMDCLVVPSTLEAMPFVILEAMAASKPVIASRIYGIPEVIVEGVTGLLVSPCDSDSLNASMKRVVVDPARSREMGAAGRHRVETHFSHERMAREVEKIYDAILSGGALPGT